MTNLKTKQNDTDVNKFINTIEDKQKREDCKQLKEIMEEVTGEEAKMWGDSIIGFGKYSYKYANGKTNEWMQVGFSPRKKNLTIYIMAGFDEYAESIGYDPKPILNKLGMFKTSKSCLYVNKLSDIEIDSLKQLIKKSIEALINKE